MFSPYRGDILSLWDKHMPVQLGTDVCFTSTNKNTRHCIDFLLPTISEWACTANMWLQAVKQGALAPSTLINHRRVVRTRGAENQLKPAETSCSQVENCQPSALHRALMWQVTKRNLSRQTASNKTCLWFQTSLSCPCCLYAHFPHGIFVTLELPPEWFMLASETETR